MSTKDTGVADCMKCHGDAYPDPMTAWTPALCVACQAKLGKDMEEDPPHEIELPPPHKVNGTHLMVPINKEETLIFKMKTVVFTSVTGQSYYARVYDLPELKRKPDAKE